MRETLYFISCRYPEMLIWWKINIKYIKKENRNNILLYLIISNLKRCMSGPENKEDYEIGLEFNKVFWLYNGINQDPPKTSFILSNSSITTRPVLISNILEFNKQFFFLFKSLLILTTFLCVYVWTCERMKRCKSVLFFIHINN